MDPASFLLLLHHSADESSVVPFNHPSALVMEDASHSNEKKHSVKCRVGPSGLQSLSTSALTQHLGGHHEMVARSGIKYYPPWANEEHSIPDLMDLDNCF